MKIAKDYEKGGFGQMSLPLEKILLVWPLGDVQMIPIHLRDSKQKQTYIGRGVNCRDCRNWRLCIIFACCVSFFSRKRCLSLQSIWGYLKTSGGGAYLPPLCCYGLVWVRVPNLFGNNLSRNDFPFSKGFMKFGWPEPPPDNYGLFSFFIGWRLLRPSLLGCPLVFPSNLIFFRKTRQFMGQKAYCPFANW